MTTCTHGFLDLPPSSCDPSTAGVAILSLPVDLTASWKRGTAEGPAAIIEASHHIEHYDDELALDLTRAAGGIVTVDTPVLPTDPSALVGRIQELAAAWIQHDRLLLALGGEHSVTWPLVQAHLKEWPDLCVVQIDAHADLRDTYMGTPYNHACPMRRIVDAGVHLTGVGIRSVDESEKGFIDSDRSRLFLATDVAGRLEDRADAIIDSLPSRRVYLTIDLDGLDPAVVPAVGTPVPGGLGWYETLAFLRRLAARTEIIGADVVELCPRKGLHYADAAAARLVCKLIGYRALAAGPGA